MRAGNQGAIPLDDPVARTPEQTDESVSATEPDWARERCGRCDWQPSRQLLRAIRRYQRHQGKRSLRAVLARMSAVLWHRLWETVLGTDIPLDSKIDGGLLLPHPNGVVVHPDARIGPNCLPFQQVTLGLGGPKPGVPTLEGHVDVGAGAKILGGVRVGPHAVIAANAVVLCDVPEGCTAVGVPARVLPSKASRERDERSRALTPSTLRVLRGAA